MRSMRLRSPWSRHRRTRYRRWSTVVLTSDGTGSRFGAAGAHHVAPSPTPTEPPSPSAPLRCLFGLTTRRSEAHGPFSMDACLVSEPTWVRSMDGLPDAVARDPGNEIFGSP